MIVAGVIEDFSLGESSEKDSVVIEGFSESSNHSVNTVDDLAIILIQEEDVSVENFYTAAILMPE